MKNETINDISITDSFEKEIFNKTFDLSVNYSEIALDLISTSEIIKEIPWVKTLASFYNISSSINARYNMKKNLVFLQEFHSHKIDEEKLRDFKEKLYQDNKYRNEIIEITLVLIEKFIDIEKAKILANLLKAHIEADLTWEDYRKISFALNHLNPSGYIFLIQSFNKEMKKTMIQSMEGEAFLLACGIGRIFEEQLKITPTGKKLYEFGLKPLKEIYCT
ncbi:hypothetical protein [Flavobacterium sp. UBA7680]|uniref:hypothetical protein n=1 Tax=Flavobacterium sp. UBA7680 TaxID=1946559 RepID=UPI0025C2EC8C|nr:hypothetical protein [Flavobacterium sp. UBA7680]